MTAVIIKILNHSLSLISLSLIEKPFNTFANRADPDQTALVRAAWSGSILFAYGNMIRYDPTLVELTSNFFVLWGTSLTLCITFGKIKCTENITPESS